MDETTALVEPYIPALRRYAWAMTLDNDGADDLVQDCLERAISRWHLRRRDGDLRAWLFAILRNLFISALRQRARRRRFVALDDPSAALSSIPAQQEDQLRLHDVLVGLNALPEDQRSVLLLVGVEDLSYEEAARVLGVPVGTVMSRLSRGRERLRHIVDTGPVSALRRVK